jgi:hypothetical protein
MSITESIKNYFAKKSNNKETGLAPEGVCPNCWGKQEWEGNIYKQIKAKNIITKNNPQSFQNLNPNSKLKLETRKKNSVALFFLFFLALPQKETKKSRINDPSVGRFSLPPHQSNNQTTLIFKY